MKIPDFVSRWAKRFGADIQSVIQLDGGINNRVYACGEGTNKHVIKYYPPVEVDDRDRMKAEVEFLNYARLVAPAFVPQLFEADPTSRCVVLEYLPGEKFIAGSTPTETDKNAAFEFFRLLNADRKIAMQHVKMDASEGFLKISSHIKNVRTRIDSMNTNHLPKQSQSNASAILEQVRFEIDRVNADVERQILAGYVEDSIDKNRRYASPSDFGFHNAVKHQNRVKFFDFEFAGLDDPAKTVIDFILQPEANVNCDYKHLINKLTKSESNDLRNRCKALGPVLHLKWVCIIASVLSPQRLQRILAVRPETDVTEFTIKRLSYAAHYLKKELPFGIS